MMATPAYDKLRDERGLFPFAMTGAELDAYVKKQVAGYRKLAEEFGLTSRRQVAARLPCRAQSRDRPLQESHE